MYKKQSWASQYNTAEGTLLNQSIQEHSAIQSPTSANWYDVALHYFGL